MKAPEKIYIYPSELAGIDYDEEWLDRPFGDSIEYTRTDAFIENAEKYLKTQFIEDVSILAGGPVHINFSAAIKNFLNYMKGE